RALVRILDGIRASSEADLEPRLVVVRQLMERAAHDQSPLRRAVWAALTRAGDALLRDGHAEITDLLLVWTAVFPDEDFVIVREASMVPEIEAAFEAYNRLYQATWAASDPDNDEAVRAVVERVAELADTLPPEQSPRVESVRLALARLGNQLARITAVGSHAKVPVDAIDTIANELGALARRAYGARRRLGLPADDPDNGLETAMRAVGQALWDTGTLDEAIAMTIDAARVLPPALAAAIERVLLWLARRPTVEEEQVTIPIEVMLPGWVPLSRQLGSFYVVRPLGRGAGGSVLLGVRSEERTRPERELIALKVPEYSGSAARNLSEQEFEALFREEASALLSLPAHPNIARFITFDAAAAPKPILAMEYVRGHNLERTLEATDLDMKRATAIIDDLFAGIEAMHRVRIAHLDVKPANVVLRDSTGRAVLVDFGLAGRRLRTGCGSPHYAAAEVWSDELANIEPFAADVYAATCVAFEVLTNRVLVNGDSLQALIDQHFLAQPGATSLAPYARDPALASFVELVRASVVCDAARRPTVSRLRAGFAAIARDLLKRAWPLMPAAVS
ncbi:MAG: protein kinase, partial [Deltaproteobacteria bacterium]|nr:protein kinase [Deltaproteobacteria bacterium]